MRKFFRNMLRAEAIRKGYRKPSKWVHNQFEIMQIAKYGKTRREINKAKGTHKRSTWKSRINSPSI